MKLEIFEKLESDKIVAKFKNTRIENYLQDIYFL